MTGYLTILKKHQLLRWFFILSAVRSSVYACKFNIKVMRPVFAIDRFFPKGSDFICVFVKLSFKPLPETGRTSPHLPFSMAEAHFVFSGDPARIKIKNRIILYGIIPAD